MSYATPPTERPGCLSGLLHPFSRRPTIETKDVEPEEIENEEIEYPFKLKNYLFTKAESSFYHVLKSAVQDKLAICPKIRLSDILYSETRNVRYWNQISQKHLDFLLCHPETMKPILGIELDERRLLIGGHDLDMEANMR